MNLPGVWQYLMPPDSICLLLLSALQVCSETSTADLRAMRQPWRSHLDRDVFLSMSKQGLRRPSVGQFGEALVSCDGIHGVLSALDVCSFSTHCSQWGVPGLLVQLKCTLYSWRAGCTHSLQKAGCHAHLLFYFVRLYFTDK